MVCAGGLLSFGKLDYFKSQGKNTHKCDSCDVETYCDSYGSNGSEGGDDLHDGKSKKFVRNSISCKLNDALNNLRDSL